VRISFILCLRSRHTLGARYLLRPYRKTVWWN
jgi:hypothetical protein